MEFFRRDVSQMQKNREAGTIYANDIDNAPEMNIVDRVFRARDILFEQEKIAVILPEEESKKHQREPKINVNDKAIYSGRNM